MVITLTPEIEHALVKAAQQQGVPPERLALAKLHESFIEPSIVEPAPATGETLFDFLQGFIGVIHSGEKIPGGAQMSTNSGQKFTELLRQKRKTNRL
jgi:hypothetical protein